MVFIIYKTNFLLYSLVLEGRKSDKNYQNKLLMIKDQIH